MSVGELAALPVSRPAVSQHLAVLRRSGLVSFEELGTRNVYRLDRAGLGQLSAWLDGFWDTALDRYAERVHEDSTGGGIPPGHEPARHERKEHPDARQADLGRTSP